MLSHEAKASLLTTLTEIVFSANEFQKTDNLEIADLDDLSQKSSNFDVLEAVFDDLSDFDFDQFVSTGGNVKGSRRLRLPHPGRQNRRRQVP